MSYTKDYSAMTPYEKVRYLVTAGECSGFRVVTAEEFYYGDYPDPLGDEAYLFDLESYEWGMYPLREVFDVLLNKRDDGYIGVVTSAEFATYLDPCAPILVR